MISSPYYVHAISPVHVGSGDADAGAEQTVMRNPVTGLPLIPGSGVKGALRALARSRQLPEGALFGVGSDDGNGHAGSVGFHDANILLLPVRSAAGTFAWVTSPYALRLHARS